MPTIYNVDHTKSFNSNGKGGNTYYSNSKGKTVYIESWKESYTGTSPKDNLKYYVETSSIEIKNCPRLNGKYISNYVVNQNFKDKVQKKLIVFYVGVNNLLRLQVTYFDNWEKVKFKIVK